MKSRTTLPLFVTAMCVQAFNGTVFVVAMAFQLALVP